LLVRKHSSTEGAVRWHILTRLSILCGWAISYRVTMRTTRGGCFGLKMYQQEDPAHQQYTYRTDRQGD